MSDYRYARSPGNWDKESWSFVLGSFRGIRIRVHLSFLILAGLFCLTSALRSGPREMLMISLPLMAMIFISVLLHEFGHCFACRSVGGDADDILMWPLGGLATCRPPHRPAEHLVTAAAGPAVNFAIMLCLLPVIFLMKIWHISLLNPLTLFPEFQGVSQAGEYVWIAFKLNYVLLLFNLLLPVFPLDGGQILRSVLWFRMSYFRATSIALRVGVIGGSIMVVVGIYCAGAIGSRYFMIAVIGLFAVIQCLMTQREIDLDQEFENEFGYDFSQGYTSLEASHPTHGASLKQGPGFFAFRARFKAWLEKRQNRYRSYLETELDRILEKISRTGMDSLTRGEKKILADAAKLRRNSSSGSRPKT